MIAWVFDHLPWWTWLIAVGAGAAITYPFWSTIWFALPQQTRLLIMAAAATVIALLAGRNMGAASEKARQKEKEREAEKRRKDVNNAVAKMDPATRKRELDKWMRD